MHLLWEYKMSWRRHLVLVLDYLVINSDFNILRLRYQTWSALKLKPNPGYFDIKQNGEVKKFNLYWVVTIRDALAGKVMHAPTL